MLSEHAAVSGIRCSRFGAVRHGVPEAALKPTTTSSPDIILITDIFLISTEGSLRPSHCTGMVVSSYPLLPRVGWHLSEDYCVLTNGPRLRALCTA